MKRTFVLFCLIAFAACLRAQSPISGPSYYARSVVFANLSTPLAGNFRYCTDCTATAPCAGSGTGAWAFRTGSVWNCTNGSAATGGTFLAADGTAAAPSYSFASTGNGDNGMFLSAANALGFATAGVERWTINASGSLVPIADSAYDIGNGTVDPRDINAARNLIIGGTSALTGNVGLSGAAPSVTIGTLLLGTFNGDQTTKFEVTNSEAAGTSAITALKATADQASLSVFAHGSGRVATRYSGIVVGGFAELMSLGSTNRGLIVGANSTGGILYFGAGSTTVAKADEATGFSLPPRAPTAGTMTTTASTSEGTLSATRTCRSWTNAMVAALAGTAGDIAWGTLPAKTVVTNAYVVITGAAAGPATVTVAVGRTAAAYIDYIIASDAKSAANTVYGDASGERGTNLTGYDLPSYTGTTVINAHFISTVGDLSTVTGSTGMVCLTLDKLP